MTEIYRVLGVLGFQWKIRTPFGVRCRWGWSGGGAPREEGEGRRSPSPERRRGTPQLKLALQLYKVQQHIYLLHPDNVKIITMASHAGHAAQGISE